MGLVAGAILMWMSLALHHYIFVKPRIDSVDPSKRLLMLDEDTVIYFTNKGEKVHLYENCSGLRFRNVKYDLATKQICKHCSKLHRAGRKHRDGDQVSDDEMEEFLRQREIINDISKRHGVDDESYSRLSSKEAFLRRRDR